MSSAPTPPADDFPAGQTGDMRDVLLSPPTGAKPSTAPAGRWEPPTAEELQKLLPQYEISALLGRGGMGAVYKGRQIALDRPVAIKILSNQLEDADASFAERFKNEARALGKLSHPGIVGVYDFGETQGGLLYIVMEFIDGTDVTKMLSQQKRLHTEHAMAITAHVCDALSYAHERGIIHRDIKPANIMVGYDGVVKVADFGLAKMTHSQNSGLTQSGMAMGTLHYMAPEALMLGSAVDHRADIYAVGVMLYQMLTGKIPQGLFELPSLQVPGLDPRYDGIIGKALREDRDLRYPSVLAMRHDLDAILTQPVVKVEPSAEKAPAALETQARPQRPGGQPYRPPQPQREHQPPPQKSSGAWWAVAVALGVLAWIVWQKLVPVTPASTAPVVESPQVAPVEAASHSPTPSVPSNATTTNPAEATKDRPFVNSLGMKFVPVPGTKVLMCIHETRRKDYQVHADDEPSSNQMWKDSIPGNPVAPGMMNDHPVVQIGLEDAQLFCAWLSKRERITYRLPKDEEWSMAAGIDHKMMNDPSASMAEYSPWGEEWPPKRKAGNYADEQFASIAQSKPVIAGYADGFVATAPVMSYDPTETGVFDMSGNVWEWCLGSGAPPDQGILRGGSWEDASARAVSYIGRISRSHQHRAASHGFRCVIEMASQPTVATKVPVVPPSAPQPTQAATTTVSTSPSTVGDPSNTKKRVIDLLALTDVKRDALYETAWSMGNDGIRSETTKFPRMAFPHSVSAMEYDLDIEFSLFGEPTEICVWFPTAGRVVKWAMQAMPKSGSPWYGFLQLDGKTAVSSPQEIFVNRPVLSGSGAHHKATIKVRKTSLTGIVDEKVFVSWKGDQTRFTDTSPQIRNLNYPAVGAVYGNITIHKATISEFVPQSPETPAPTLLPTGPTTWTDTKGRSITATFKAIAIGNVLLDIAGKVTPVPLNTLSAESQKLAQQMDAARKLADASDPAKATNNQPFVNSLGMKFVPVPGTNTLFCIHETRKADYATFAKATPRVSGFWENTLYQGEPVSFGSDHPVCNISWQDCQDFCLWLSRKEGHAYRLPTDREWSFAVGIGNREDAGTSPHLLSDKLTGEFPWGRQWPPPARAGNLGDTTMVAKFPKRRVIPGYTDGFATTAPVMSFTPNPLGLYDMSGNVWEFCEDWYDETHTTHVIRGLNFDDGGDSSVRFLSSHRGWSPVSNRHPTHGFRVVLELEAKPTSASPAAPVIPSSTSAVTRNAPEMTALLDFERELRSHTWLISDRNWELRFENDHRAPVDERVYTTRWHWWITGPRSLHIQFAAAPPAYDPNIGVEYIFDKNMKTFTAGKGKNTGVRQSALGAPDEADLGKSFAPDYAKKLSGSLRPQFPSK